ncbi:P-loop containing nucleoside triphosphate hydrolase protein [Peniophora sp. CONT]|nr:P-loop containing nucleoside triphosphate hydrolase protein [Peniophora sp. CONT]
MALQTVLMSSLRLDDPGIARPNELLVPAYASAASLGLLCLTGLYAFATRNRTAKDDTAVPEETDTTLSANGNGYSKRLSLASLHGGKAALAWKALRALCVFSLLGLAIADVLRTGTPAYAALTATYAYASLLAAASLFLLARLSRHASVHLAAVLLVILAVFLYRDVWPLMTYALVPADDAEGAQLWAKIALLLVAGLVAPMATPRRYVPYDHKEPSAPNPVQTASLFELAFLSYCDPLVWQAYRSGSLPYEDFPPLPDYDNAKYLVARSFPYVDRFAGAKGSLLWGLVRIFSEEYCLIACSLVLKVAGSFLGPIGLNRLLAYLENGGEDAFVRPWVWVLALFLDPFLGTFGVSWYMYLTSMTLVRIEAIFTSLVFEHALRIRPSADTGAGDAPSSDDSAEGDEASTSGDTTAKSRNLAGKLNNLISTDLNNITLGKEFMMLAFYAPLMTGFSIWFLYAILGWGAFVGIAVMVLLLPLPGYLATSLHGVQESTMKKTDARVQVVTEIMNVIRMIKLFGWESKINERIAATRKEELKGVRKREILTMLIHVLQYIIPLLQMLASFITYVQRAYPYASAAHCNSISIIDLPSAAIVFSAISVFNILQGQLMNLTWWTPQLVQGAPHPRRRLSQLLSMLTELLDEYTGDQENYVPYDAERADVIGFHNARFTWSVEDGASTPRRRFALSLPGDVLFKPGCINLIVGATGSGKSSMLMALLGEMHFDPLETGGWFNLPRSEGVAYAAQEPWIQNETIKDNILFGSPFDEARYKKTLHQCGLEPDIALFEAGDKTEVGEKGLTLSGGQKARVSLARAVYSSAHVVVLDEVLAALDVHTAKWIVDKCLKGDLIAGRTVILVTHNIALTASAAAHAISLGNGRVLAHGSVSAVLDNDSTLTDKIKEVKEEMQKTKEDLQEDTAAEKVLEKKVDGKLVLAEELAEGTITWAALKLFFDGLGGSVFWTLFIGGYTINAVLQSVTVWFLGYWSEQYDLHPASEVSAPFYLSGYALIILITVIVYAATNVLWIVSFLNSCQAIHVRLVSAVLGTTLRVLDYTPISRVITRCTQDISQLDGPFPQAFVWFVEMTTVMLVKLASVVIFTPPFLVPGLVTVLLGGWVGRVYVGAQMSIKREMSSSKAPVMGHFGAAVAGLTSIRAYGAQTAFKTESYKRINRYTRTATAYFDMDRWIHIRMDFLAGIFVASLGLYIVYGPGRTGILASDVGFSLSMAVSFASSILYWIRVMNMYWISLERIHAYTVLEQEPKAAEEGEPPAYWPSSGELRVENLSARYSKDSPEILHNLSFTVKSGERIGIVGRTGSGKSSLTLSLLRAIITEGDVYLDGRLTSKMNLNALRSSITIIPQVPELLSGTIRDNLDPFGQSDDAMLNSALRSAGLGSLQNDDADEDGRITLETEVASGGGNLSVGQRQIIALARALVRGSKLLILDEATSAIDYRTDTAIQKSLRSELPKDATVLTIAHRLQTIMDADRILVLDSGRIAEFDTPERLLEQDGILRAMVDESDDKDTLRSMVKKMIGL